MAGDMSSQRRPAPSASLLLALFVACSLADGISAAAVLVDIHPRAVPTPEPTQAAPGSAPVAAPLTTVPYRALNVVPWPLPTALPDEGTLNQRQSPRQFGAFGPGDLFGRADNTVCGYIGGDPSLPATCSAGSHCVLDAEHGAVGCCPNGVETCTAGVFTGCVDGSNDATDVNPYVYTCGGGSFCYKNSFPGGYYQYGCGSASTLGQSVAATASGKPTLALTSERVTFTGTFATTTSTSETKTSSKTSSKTTSSSSTKTTSSKTSSSTTSSSSSSSSPSSSSSTSSKTSKTSSSATHTPTDGPSLSTDPGNQNQANTGVNSGDRAGVIIGATISGVAGLIAIIALIVFFCWKKRRNGGNYTTRKGPSNFRGASGSFQALRSTPDDFEQGLLNPEMAMGTGATGTYTHISAGGPPPRPPPPGDYDNPFKPGGDPGPGPVPGSNGSNGPSPDSGGDHDDDLWVTPAIPAAMAAVAVANPGASSLTPNRRSSAGGNSILSRDPSRRSSYRGVVTTNGTGAPGISSVSGSIVSRAASNVAMYNQISQQSPYYDSNGQPPPPQSQVQPAAAPGLHSYGNLNSNYQPTHPDDLLVDHDRVPLNREFDEFSRGYQDVLSRIGEEDPSELSQSASHNNLAGNPNNVSNDSTAHDLSNDTSHQGDSLLPRNLSNLAPTTTNNTLGTERDSSGVLPLNQGHPLPTVNLRGGGSSGIACSLSTTSGSGNSLSTGVTGNRNSIGSAPGSSVGTVGNRGSTNSGQQLSLNMTSPSLSIDGQLVGVGGVSPPAATLAAGSDGVTKTLSPPASPPMRPLWQQNRQKSRNLMWS